MARLAALKAATSLSDVARLLDFKPHALSYVLYKQPEVKKYKTFRIPKRNGGQRTINAPVEALKLLQRRLSDLLQDCVEETNASNGRKDRAAHGFKRKRSIITNASQHRRRRFVFNLDLEDFFPSINFGRVRGFFVKNRDFALHQDAATVIAQIACYKNSLPQGSPCSPVISNLVAHLLDMRLVSLASAAGCTYSRYADDLTFSTNKKRMPPMIAVPERAEGAASHLWVASRSLRRIIERTGFRINAKKTHMMYRASRQDVTGLVVNEKINVRWEYRHNARAMVNRLVRTGTFEVLGVTQREGQAVLEKQPGTLAELHGKLGFIDSIDVYNGAHKPGAPSGELSSTEKVYRKFLIYSAFYAAATPVVICEGETDNVYLTHAIRSLASEFPDLAAVKPDKKVQLKVRLYKYPRTSTSRLLGLSGGSGSLSTFIATYKRETKRFTTPVSGHPVVILYDNDEGAAPIRSVIKQISNASVSSTQRFAHVIGNLYAVPTPLGSANSSKIEDFFDDTIKETAIAGKVFHEGKDFDVDKHYGKKIFAHRVVKPNAETINFGGFRPLLANLVAAIGDYKLTAPANGSDD